MNPVRGPYQLKTTSFYVHVQCYLSDSCGTDEHDYIMYIQFFIFGVGSGGTGHTSIVRLLVHAKISVDDDYICKKDV